MGSLRGTRVVPGEYTIRLSADQEGLEPTEIQATVLADPRVKATADDYQQQQIALDRISGLAKDVHQSVNRFHQVKSQLAGRLRMLKELNDAKQLVAVGQTAMKRINQWEAQLIQPKQETFQDVINFPNQLNAELITLAGALDTNDPRPTKSSLERLEELAKHWQKLSQEFQAIVDGPIRDFNAAYKESGLPALIVPTPNG